MHALFLAALTFTVPAAHTADENRPQPVFVCRADNDLFRLLAANLKHKPTRFDTPAAAVEGAPKGGGLLILADGYPDKPTAVDEAVLKAAARKSLRLYVEYPADLPGVTIGKPRGVEWERVVVSSDAFGKPLPRLQILAAQGCKFVPLKGDKPDLVLARVAGFDRAVYGLPGATFPLLLDVALGEGYPRVTVATTKLSQMVTGRFAPANDWRRVWQAVFDRVAPETVTVPSWEPTVRPTYGPRAELPADAEAEALRRGLEWFRAARLLIHPSRADELRRAMARGEVIAPPAPDAPVGDGSLGILEGFSTEIGPDGRQRQRLPVRSDCVSETAMAFALAGRVRGDTGAVAVGRNLLDYLYTRSGAVGGERGDPKHGSYGLVSWGVSSPGWMIANYGDDNARVLLATFAAATAAGTDRWDEPLMRSLLANLRTSGPLGFRENRIDQKPLGDSGWEAFFKAPVVSYQPHYQAYLWACHLAAYQVTKDPLFRDRARTAIRLTMKAYPAHWRWTNGMQQERARMLLPLAWLVRVDDTPEHRKWLKTVADDLLAHQSPSGAIAERLGPAGQGDYPPPGSNAAFGTNEAPLIQSDGDPAADLLYTTNFALLGLHEAAAATGDPFYRKAEDALVRFLCRIQTRSERHPDLDGAWFRAFDFRRWEYWASSGDHGWGAWSIETGWTQAWVVSVLALRKQEKALWDSVTASAAGRHYPALRTQMLPDAVVRAVGPKREEHAALGKPVTATPPDKRYPGDGPGTVTDGALAAATHTDPQWLGYEGTDATFTIDLGRAVTVRHLAVDTLQSTRLGVYAPARAEFEVSADGKTFRPAATVQPDTDEKRATPAVVRLSAGDLSAEARYVRVRLTGRGTIPAGHPAAGAKAWLFVGEIVVNPKAP